MKLTAADLYRQKIIEKIIPEPKALKEETLSYVTDILDEEITDFLKQYEKMPKMPEEELLKRRYERFRKF